MDQSLRCEMSAITGYHAQALLPALTTRRALCSAAEPVTLEELIEWLSEVFTCSLSDLSPSRSCSEHYLNLPDKL